LPWLDHPSYVPVRDALIGRLREGSHQMSTRFPIVFLCGGAGSTRRDSLAQYLRQKTPALVFYAEEVWGTVRLDPAGDALQMEGRLAELADMVVVIVESAGTIAELGAFSLNQRLLTKLLPIVDSQYARDESFINTGPLRSVSQESAFRPVIHTKFKDSFLLCAGQVEQRLKLIPNLSYKLAASTIAFNSKQLLVFLVALVALLFPVSERHLDFYLSRIFDLSRPVRVGELLSLAVSLGVLREVVLRAGPDGDRFYVPAAHRPMLETEHFDSSAARARIFGVIQRIPRALTAIEQLEMDNSRAAR